MNPQPTLTTERLTLRPFTMNDAPDVARLAGDPMIASTTARIPHPYTINDANTWLSALPDRYRRDESVVFAITRHDDRGETRQLIGSIGLELFSAEVMVGVAELGYWIGVSYHGCGYATEAGRAVIDYGFKTLNLRRIEAHSFDNNPASARVLEKVGMSREGVMRSRIIKNNTPHDTIHYAILYENQT